MSTVAQLAQIFLRAYATDGVPASGINDPSKTDGLAVLNQIDAALSDMALFSSVGIAYATLAALNADLAHTAGTIGLVYNDGTAANDGIYVKLLGSGSGSWQATGIALASSIATLVTSLAAAAPWYNTSFCQVSQLQQALVVAGNFQAVENAISGDPTNAVDQQWTRGVMVTQTGPLGAFIKATLAFTDGQMTTLFAAARATSF